MKTITHSEQETREFAKKFASRLKGGIVLCLHGELGAGKTTFVKGLAEGLNIKENITSPTFTLMNAYEIGLQTTDHRLRHELAVVRSPASAVVQLVHIDTYRLKDEKELLEIGAEDYIGASDSITVIEWPEKIANFLKTKKIIEIFLKHASGDEREIIIED